MENIHACEKEYLINYLNKIENISSNDIVKAYEDNDNYENSILEVNDNNAVITINGPMSKNGPSPIARFFGFGGTAYTDIIEAVNQIKDNDQIKTVMLDMDTPGGEVTGVDDVYQSIQELSRKKKVIAINSGMIASAGYWIASAANEIIATSPVAETGSIGVVIVQIDDSEMAKKIGIKRVKIVSRNAPNKNPDASTKTGKDTLQDRADAIERIFINRISAGRRVSEDYVKENYGKGGLLVAEDPGDKKPDALSVKMIDGIETIEEIKNKWKEKNSAVVEESVDSPIAIQYYTEAGATPFKNLPVIDKVWDSTAAIKRVRTFTKSTEKPGASYKNAFFWYDAENAENFGAYKLPFADVVDGKLVAVRRGVFAANGAMKGARGGVQIPAADRSAVQNHIDKYIKKIEKMDQEKKKTNQEKRKMDLKELIKENPEIEKEIDSIKTENFNAGVASVQERINKILPFISSDKYPAPVKTLSLQVLEGKESVATLTATVSAYDAISEHQKNNDAVEETDDLPETPPQDHTPVSNDGVIRTEADYNAEITAIKSARSN